MRSDETDCFIVMFYNLMPITLTLLEYSTNLTAMVFSVSFISAWHKTDVLLPGLTVTNSTVVMETQVTWYNQSGYIIGVESSYCSLENENQNTLCFTHI